MCNARYKFPYKGCRVWMIFSGLIFFSLFLANHAQSTSNRSVIQKKNPSTQCVGESAWKCKSSNTCIPKSSTCDGKKDCADGSDESDDQCKKILSPSSRTNGNSTENGSCDVPSGPLNASYTIDEDDNWTSIASGSKVPKFARLLITCAPGYSLPDGAKTQELNCIRSNKWLPALKSCTKLCPKLRAANMELSCYREGRQTNCDGDLLPGTTVRPQCESLFHPDRLLNYKELKCQANGQWDRELFTCEPDCGIPNSETLLSDAQSSKGSGMPWHVAIYEKGNNYTLLCGGTLISRRMVLSAAHCFYDRKRGVANNAADYEIVVAKYTKDYKIVDNKEQQAIKIKDIIYTDAGYNPTSTAQYGQDIALITLKEAVKLSRFVLPVCIDWNASPTRGFKTRDGELGRVAGWGTKSNVLLFSDLPFISYRNCLGKLERLSPDHFCAGSATGPGPEKGDSGGGLVFLDPQRNLYFLRGIVSTKDRNSTSSVAAFTDLSKHLDWLYKVRNDVAEQMEKLDTGSIAKIGLLQHNIENLLRFEEVVRGYAMSEPVSKFERLLTHVDTALLAVVTGCASGIGLATSKKLMENGLIVVGLDVKEITKETVLAETSKPGGDDVDSKPNKEDDSNSDENCQCPGIFGKFIMRVCDVGDENDLDRTFQWIRENVNEIWVLVNCAGVLPRTTLLDASRVDIEKTFTVNVQAILMCTQRAAKMMIENSVPGHIININSINGHYIRNSPNEEISGTMIYAASKHAVTVLTEGLRREMSKRNVMIKFTSISPGGVRTELSKDSAAQLGEYNPKTTLLPESVARACITVLDTPPTELISELTIMGIHQQI